MILRKIKWILLLLPLYSCSSLDKVMMEELDKIIQTETAVEDDIYCFFEIEESATPLSGLPAFYKELNKKLRYKDESTSVHYKIYISFKISKEGQLTDFKMVRGVKDEYYNQEALRVIKEMSAFPWTPYKLKGKPIDSNMVLPIHFKKQ